MLADDMRCTRVALPPLLAAILSSPAPCPAHEASEKPVPEPQLLLPAEPPPAEEPPPTGWPPPRIRIVAAAASPRAQERDADPSCLCGCGHAPAGPSFALRGHVFTAAWIERTLHGVIANDCQSKTYLDVLPLDGGTVGISHFAAGSLRTLYAQMDQRRYFGERAGRVPDRPYDFAWWREGMARFLRSPDGRAAQQRAWRSYISPALQAALEHGWSTDRELAIAAGIANSLGAFGFQQLAQKHGWDPERSLLYYARLTPHKERRRLRLNRYFPPGRQTVAWATSRAAAAAAAGCGIRPGRG